METTNSSPGSKSAPSPECSVRPRTCRARELDLAAASRQQQPRAFARDNVSGSEADDLTNHAVTARHYFARATQSHLSLACFICGSKSVSSIKRCSINFSIETFTFAMKSSFDA